ncbi:unnamed protein product [Echinostoma caproni]|uniref:Uncharacterized protein n=1 Tax=Echinostoma caproni TaxID=27848 RepID=A0A183A5C4_9TREM|nr:unnamed protein product [Echinostoma caproni]
MAVQFTNSCESEAQRSAAKLNRALQLERRRAARVYALANRVLEQRSDVEAFFLDSLDQVRDEIATTQANYKHDAKAAYETRLRLAYYGAAEYPRIRTFQPGLPSTNTVYDDLKAANCMPCQKKVQFSELTWEQKERVLAKLFARMNAGQTRRQQSLNESTPVNCLCPEGDNHDKQADGSHLSKNSDENEIASSLTTPENVIRVVPRSAPDCKKTILTRTKTSNSLPEPFNGDNGIGQNLVVKNVESK